MPFSNVSARAMLSTMRRCVCCLCSAVPKIKPSAATAALPSSTVMFSEKLQGLDDTKLQLTPSSHSPSKGI